MLSRAQESALYRAVGDRVQRLRSMNGLTQEDLADLIGLSRASIANLEAGRQRVPLHHLFAIAAKVSASVADLMPCLDELEFENVDEPAANIDIVVDGRALTDLERQVIAHLLRSQSRDL